VTVYGLTGRWEPETPAGELGMVFDLTRADPWSSGKAMGISGDPPAWMLDADNDGVPEIFAGGIMYRRADDGTYGTWLSFPRPSVDGC